MRIDNLNPKPLLMGVCVCMFILFGLLLSAPEPRPPFTITTVSEILCSLKDDKSGVKVELDNGATLIVLNCPEIENDVE